MKRLKPYLKTFIIMLLGLSAPLSAATTPDPVSNHPGPVSFEKALQEILDRSTDIAIQKTQIESAEATVLNKKGNFLPSLELDDITEVTNPGTNTATYAATAKWNLFRFGADIASLKGAKRNSEAQKELLEDINLRTELSGIAALIDVISGNLKIKALNIQVGTFKDFLQIAKERYQQGLLPSQEVDKVIVDLDNLQASLTDAHLSLSTAQATLQRLLGHVDVELEWPWKTKLKPETTQRLTSRKFFLEARPDFRSSFSLLESADDFKDHTFRRLLPSLDVSYSYGYLNALGQGGNSVGMLTLSIPLFDHFKELSDYQIQVQNFYAAEFRLREIQRTALSDWTSAKEQFELATSAAQSREETLSVSKHLYNANFLRYKQGRASANDLRIDQKRLFDAEILTVQGWATAHLAYAKLCHALGLSVFKCEQ